MTEFVFIAHNKSVHVTVFYVQFGAASGPEIVHFFVYLFEPTFLYFLMLTVR